MQEYKWNEDITCFDGPASFGLARNTIKVGGILKDITFWKHVVNQKTHVEPKRRFVETSYSKDSNQKQLKSLLEDLVAADPLTSWSRYEFGFEPTPRNVTISDTEDLLSSQNRCGEACYMQTDVGPACQ